MKKQSPYQAVRGRLSKFQMDLLFGGRCPSFNPSCPICKAYQKFDKKQEVSFLVSKYELVKLLCG